MKKSLVIIFLAAILVSVTMWVGGCSCIPGIDENRCSQPGETSLEGKVRHVRNARVNHEEMNSDIDRAMLYDRPSEDTPIRVP
jgi:hypothetical protein